MTPSPSAPATAALGSRTVGAIAATLPGATAVFRRFKMDFCCGGGATLADAAAAKGVNLAEVTAALAALDPRAHPPAPEATDALIDHILTRYHETHRRELPELVRLARRVEARHEDHPEVPAGLADLLETIKAAVEDHLEKEEMVLFPMMRVGGSPIIFNPIDCMRQEHDEHGENIERLRALSRNGRLPEDACPTWAALYAGIDKFIDDLMEHIHLENNVLFPRFE